MPPTDRKAQIGGAFCITHSLARALFEEKTVPAGNETTGARSVSTTNVKLKGIDGPDNPKIVGVLGKI
jgi:hypothetical protein